MSFNMNSFLASSFVSMIGFVLFTYGKKMRRFPQSAVGVLMMLYPYVVSSVSLMFGIAAGLLVLLFAATRMGM